MRYDNNQIRHRFTHHSFNDAATVDAAGVVRDILMAAAVELNELLREGRDKDKAIDAVELALLHARKSLELFGRRPEA